MKNTLGGQFYFFQARRGGPTRVRPATHPKPETYKSSLNFWAAKAQMARTGQITHRGRFGR